ncbi:MAG: methylated-DNA--[protein]-cysteine S-methyltransferase [Magnetospirillum sp.]|nr:methylated-DNA--[protein]-cysteine S-methyltransferase [Magnetospirillum sp.]
MPQLSFNSPIGPLAIAEEDGRIVSIDWGWPPDSEETPLLLRARDQLEAYFTGTLRAFDLPLDPPGTAFQRRVWAALQRIPFGAVKTYGALAAELGTAPRALGGACGRNPIPIVIPCHRVLGTNGSLGGYSGLDGVDTKRFLLELEGVLTPVA